MKTKLLLFATALLCLAACNKQEIIDGPDDQGKEGDYMIEIAELDQPTKSNPSTVELNLANLVSPSSKSITAQLKKRSGSSWVNVDNGVSYSWSATSEDNQKFSGSGTVNQSCNVTAKKAGSGNITVSAAIGGTIVATQPVPVNVSDDRALSWTNATTSLTAGEVKTAVLNSNFSGTVTVSSDNSSFLVGTSENSLNATTSVTFSSNKTQTIYYKYTGSSQTTVKIEALSSNDSINAIMDITVSKKTSVPEKIKFIFAFDNYNSNQVKKVEFRCNSQTYSYKTLPTSLVVDYQYETILEDFVIYFYKEHIDAMPQTVKTGSRPISRVQVKRDDAVIFAEPFYYNFNESDGQSNFFSESKDLSIQCSEGEGTVEYYVNIINPVN